MTQVGQYTSMVVDMCVLRGTTQVGQYTSMVVDMCKRYDTGRSVYNHGSRHVCVERNDTGIGQYTSMVV